MKSQEVLWGKDEVYVDGSRELLQEAYGNAVTIENREAYGAEHREIKYIGTIQKKDRLYKYYKDDEGDYWYRTLIQTPHGPISMYEHIFGRKEKVRYRF